MKKLISLIAAIAAAAMLAGCTVASDTAFTITVQNKSPNDANNVKVGSIYIGTVFKGQTVTYTYFTAESNAQISADSFDSYRSDLDGKIDLKLGYVYTLRFLNNTDDDLVYSISATKYDDSNDTIIME